MNIQQIYELTVVYEAIKTGSTICGDINRVYKYISNDKLASKKQKIREIKKYWESMADQALIRMAANRLNNEKK